MAIAKGPQRVIPAPEVTFGNKSPQGSASLVEPVWEYDHQIGKSITGGYVYRGTKLPMLDGAYLYADFVTGRIWALYYDQAAGKVTKNLRIPTTKIPVLAFGQDQNGEVYYSIGSVKGQSIYRFQGK